ncbi:MAG TPA: SpoIIE family protein phosphatase [Gemmataceae bacterium]|nr:SpoIIE family protein phosphatase [Gemmataceae bacterium]
MAVLLITQGPDAGREYSLDGDTTVLGRQPDCNICLLVKAVSRQHAQILKTPAGYQIEDLDSSNGTYLNGTRLTAHQRVAIGERDFVTIGPYTLSLRAMPTPASTEGNLIIREQVNAVGPPQSFYGQDPAQKLQTVLEISQHLSRTLDTDQLVDKLLDQLIRLFPQADRGMVLLGPPERLLVRGQRTRHKEDASAYPYSRSIVKKALEEGIGILSDDIRGDARFQASATITSLDIRSLLCVPLIGSDQKRLGVIQLDRSRTGRAFQMDDLQLLTTIGLHVAIVLDNAALHQEALREQRFHQELAVARDIQQGYLPADFGDFNKDGIEVFANVHPARQVSGDLYDLMEVSDNRLAFFLGDVSGKGMPAALYMVAVHALGRHIGASGDPPTQTLTRLNGALVADNPSGMFVTLAHGHYQRGTGEIVMASGGHPLPLIRRADGSVEPLQHKTGRLLGYDGGDLHLTDARLTLNPGDMLVFYTDGYTEAREPAKRQMFGLERLSKVVAGFTADMPLATCAAKAKTAIDQFTASSELQDDLTLLLLRRVPHKSQRA